ncbi:hypothetical protein ACFY2J_14380 [Streptomyces collinus]|uniref:hypothetical protein n=1 Tax=Streptomyces collinus TaxID=42684 RepID=UPI0036A84A4C
MTDLLPAEGTRTTPPWSSSSCSPETSGVTAASAGTNAMLEQRFGSAADPVDAALPFRQPIRVE